MLSLEMSATIAELDRERIERAVKKPNTPDTSFNAGVAKVVREALLACRTGDVAHPVNAALRRLADEASDDMMIKLRRLLK